MPQSKIEIKVGTVQFVGEGEQEWLGTQLDKLLERIPELLKIELNSTPQLIYPEPERNGRADSFALETNHVEIAKQVPSNLATFLREKNTGGSQVNKFLLTALFLQHSGKNRIGTADIVQALKSANQSKLSNPSDALNQNVGKGYCEKEGAQFFVTQEGVNFVDTLK